MRVRAPSWKVVIAAGLAGAVVNTLTQSDVLGFLTLALVGIVLVFLDL